jgi:hypothetical protein
VRRRKANENARFFSNLDHFESQLYDYNFR